MKLRIHENETNESCVYVCGREKTFQRHSWENINSCIIIKYKYEWNRGPVTAKEDEGAVHASAQFELKQCFLTDPLDPGATV